MTKYLVGIGVIGLLFSGCSMLPYENSFACEGGSNVKVCKRVSDVYQMDMDNYYKQQNIQSKEPFYTKDYYEYRLKVLEYQNKKIEEQNTKLKDIIDGVSISKLEKPIKIDLEVNNVETQKNTSKVIQLNKPITVCVLNANIRKEPSCKAQVIKSVKKGTKLYALYEKNSWIKIKNSGYIHKSLTHLCGSYK